MIQNIIKGYILIGSLYVATCIHFYYIVKYKVHILSLFTAIMVEFVLMVSTGFAANAPLVLQDLIAGLVSFFIFSALSNFLLWNLED